MQEKGDKMILAGDSDYHRRHGVSNPDPNVAPQRKKKPRRVLSGTARQASSRSQVDRQFARTVLAPQAQGASQTVDRLGTRTDLPTR